MHLELASPSFTNSFRDNSSYDGRLGDRDNERTARERALAVAAAWSDLDPDEVLDALDRIRHSSPPTPPIDLDD